MVQKSGQNFGFIIQDVARLLRRNFNRRIQDLDLTQAQWQMLAHLSRHPGLRQAEIADKLEMQPISVARLLDRMQDAGWVERRPDPDDRRAFNLFLTEKATPVVDEMWIRAKQTRKSAFKGISAADRDAVLTVLEKVRENLCQDRNES